MRLYADARRRFARIAEAEPYLAFVDTAVTIPRDQAWQARRGTLRVSDGHFNAADNAWYAEHVRDAVAAFLSAALPDLGKP